MVYEYKVRFCWRGGYKVYLIISNECEVRNKILYYVIFFSLFV